MQSNDYEHIVTILTGEILKNRLIIFIGAGCSMAVGLPSWKELLEALIEKYRIQTKETNLLKLASRIERTIGRSNLVDEISDSCRVQKNEGPSVHELLTDLGVNLFITTNYDHLVENAFRKKGIEPHIVHNDMDLPIINSTAKTIVKLHGDIDSPSSLVCTEKDYRQYKSNHRGFVEWLKARSTELTILFLGTSFDDPRLVEADDHVIEYFGDHRRNHVIVLKKPKRVIGEDIDEFEAELDDFEDRCRSFESERGFLVLAVQEYSEIEDLLRKIKDRVLLARVEEKKRSDGIADLYRMQVDQYEMLDRKFSEHVDITVQELCSEIAGPGCFPSFSKAKPKIELLLKRLQNPPHRLSPETIVHGYLTLVDAFAATGRPEDLSKASELLEQAISGTAGLREGHDLTLRTARSKAKLLYLNGDLHAALEILQHDSTPKGIFWRLSILLASGNLDEAFLLIKDCEPQLEWAGEAVKIWVQKGAIETAEALYAKFASQADSFQDSHEILRLRHQMAMAYFRRAVLLSGNPHPFEMIPGRLPLEAADA